MRRALLVVGFISWGFAAAVAQNQKAPRSPTSAPFGFLDANRVLCSLTNVGGLCTNYSSIVGGGVWPASAATGYMFGSGLQFAAIIPDTAGGGRPVFAWAGDTVGVLFFDVNGTQETGEPLTEVFNSRDTLDLSSWPTAALVRDASLFDFVHVGQKAVSPQDIWMRYWDGNARLLSGRTHPMGIAVDQRAMAFPYPGPNADIVYFVFTIYNVTARAASAYANSTIPPEIQPEIAALGARFQDSSEAQLAVAIPDAGYTLDSVYVGLQVDPDIGAARDDYTTASLPFGMAMAYTGQFSEPGWDFPAEIFGAPPFAAAPGFVGAMFPRSPAPITTFSTFAGSLFSPPQNVNELWRWLSFNQSPANGDNAICNEPPPTPKEGIVCFVSQSTSDVRYMLSFGPFTLAPGEAKTIVLSYLFAAPLDTINAYVDSIMRPRWAFTGDSIAADPSKVLPPERAAGWITQNDANGNGIIEAAEVTTARRSLLHKAQVAQAFVDLKFAVPTGPAAPDFFLVPGDNQVTVVWQPSATEKTGDPYFTVASDSTSPLYDPNYRRFDVEGYRIYRGRDPKALQLVAQVDYEGTSFVDYVGAVGYPGRCAPELGITTDCPVAFGPTPSRAVSDTMPIAGRMVQVPEGGRILSTSGALSSVQPDTFPTGSYPPLNNQPVTYVYIDSAVKNSFRYYYVVIAFDFNSIRSGPISFESSGSIKATTPRAPSGQETAGGVQPMRLLGADGTQLDPAAPLPSIDAATGMFSGPMPPADGLTLALNAVLPELLVDGTVAVTVDSVLPGVPNLFGLTPPRPATYFLRIQGPGVSDTVSLTIQVDGFTRDESSHVNFRAIALNDSQARRFGGDSTYSLTATTTITVPGVWHMTSWGRADANGSPSNSSHNGPRWWAGTPNENTPTPNSRVCTPASSGCVQPDLSLNAGRLPGVDTLFHLQAFSTVPNTPMRELEAIGGAVYRAADMRVYWGAAGAIDSVVDLTHHVRVPYSPKIRASWGVLNDSSFTLGGTNPATTGDGNNALLTWADAVCVDPAPADLNQCGGAAQGPAILQNHARLSPVSARSSTYANAPALPQTGQGFILYINGHFFLMQLGALPAAGTVWNVRFYSGNVTGTAAQANYDFLPAGRPPAVPGLRAAIAFQGSQLSINTTTDSLLARIHTVPDPFYVQSGYEVSADTLALKFVHLPARAIIRIYSVSGILVAVLVHDDPTGGGEVTWNLRSRSNKGVASGVYFYHVETPDHRTKLGRFTVVTGPGPRR